jgi:ubiquinone/menaquinone biosynthesis C-methylase UbiE
MGKTYSLVMGTRRRVRVTRSDLSSSTSFSCHHRVVGNAERDFDATSVTRATYDRIAQRYAERQEVDQTNGPSLFEELEAAFLLRVPNDGIVLDVGCGPGLDGVRIIERGRRVVGVDVSWGMLTIASPKLNGRVLQADMRALPVGARSVDGVWAVASVLHVPASDTLGTLGEFERVLRRGGALALVTAVDDTTGFEPVPYAPGEQRWFVYRDGALLNEQLADVGFDVMYRSLVVGSRRWATFCALKH